MTHTHAQATAERDAGMAQAMKHAEQVEDGWGERAYKALCEFARWAKTCKPGGFTSFDFRTLMPMESPTTDKAFGPVFKRAAKAGVIKRCGFVPHPERHASPTVLWQTV